MPGSIGFLVRALSGFQMAPFFSLHSRVVVFGLGNMSSVKLIYWHISRESDLGEGVRASEYEFEGDPTQSILWHLYHNFWFEWHSSQLLSHLIKVIRQQGQCMTSPRRVWLIQRAFFCSLGQNPALMLVAMALLQVLITLHPSSPSLPHHSVCLLIVDHLVAHTGFSLTARTGATGVFSFKS